MQWSGGAGEALSVSESWGGDGEAAILAVEAYAGLDCALRVVWGPAEEGGWVAEEDEGDRSGLVMGWCEVGV